MLIDEAEIIARGGHGGPGKVSFYKLPQKGPDGGNGGKGGNVYLIASNDLMDLKRFTTQRVLQAENGTPGGSNRKSGKDGKDLEIKIPIGSLVKIEDLGEVIEISQVVQRILICQGGKGGKGNYEFKSPSNTTPRQAQPGLNGQEKRLKIILRFIADVGLIGLPNVGKSSLLNELTNASVKTAEYPFTTLESNLGTFEGKVIADIPGLIEGSSLGKGLGHRFLKHIEKVKILLHCISLEGEDLLSDFNIIQTELKKFNPDLLKKKQILLLTKADLISKKEVEKSILKLKPSRKRILTVSIHDWDSIEAIKKILSNL